MKLPLVGLSKGNDTEKTLGVSYENAPAIVPGCPATETIILASAPTYGGMEHVIEVCEMEITFVASRGCWEFAEVMIETITSEDTVPKLFPNTVKTNNPLVGPFRGTTCARNGLLKLKFWPDVALSPSTSTTTARSEPDPGERVHSIVSGADPTEVTGHIVEPTRTLTLSLSFPKLEPVIVKTVFATVLNIEGDKPKICGGKYEKMDAAVTD
jgi:hypothetical protein